MAATVLVIELALGYRVVDVGRCHDGLDGTLCQTCSLEFHETTNYFSNAKDPVGSFIKNVIDTELREDANAAQDRCCLAGI